MAETAAQKRKRLAAEAKALSEKTAADFAKVEASLPPAPTVTPRSLGMRIDETPAVDIAPVTPASQVYLPEPSETDMAAAQAATTQAAADYKAATPTSITPITQTPVSASLGSTVGANAALQAAYAAQLAASQAAQDKAARQSAYDLLLQQFKQYGLESLVTPLKDLISQNVSPSEFAIKLQNTDAYKQRFAANQDRIAKGLQALTPAQYIALEDQYQNVMRNYGLPSSYYSKDSMGTQAGFNKFISNDVSAAELEDRIATAQQRLINADPNVMNALKQFYPSISQGDVLAYTLDPTNALQDIKRKVTAAEIGGAALNQGLMTSQASAEDLAKYGITKAQAQAGYEKIGSFLPSATNLADIYQGQGLGPYTQQTAEQEIFGTSGAAESARKRRKLSELEQAQFSGKSGASAGALSRDRAMSPYMLGTPGAGAY